MVAHVIYIPGLGDTRPYGQKFITSLWRVFGLKVHYFPIGWADHDPFESKFKKLLAKIDRLQKKYGAVYLIGVSAGASAAINAFAARPEVEGVVCISGKIQHPETINPRYFINNPPFKDSIFRVSDSLAKLSPADKKQIMSIHPIYDQTVPISHTLIPGSVEKTVPSFGHIMSIYYTIIFRPRLIARFYASLSQTT